MSNEFRRVAILGRVDDPRVAEPMAALAAHLADRGIEVMAAPGADVPASASTVPEPEMAATADLIVAIGGDGTMLYAAALGGERGVPLLGINRGRLGFLADVTPDEMLHVMDQVLAGEYVRETRLMLTACLLAPDGTEQSASALNDVVLQRRGTGRMVDFETRIAGHYVNTHSGDGLIVATPTGSTAYALSCGGPIIEPALNAVVVVPVCPHTLSDRPIVVPADREIEVRLLAYSDSKAEVMVDGRLLGALEPTDRLLIREADRRITLIHPPGYDYFDLLRSKLHWGRDSRVRAGDGRR
ncbi:MAG TPA: NAD(+)/NADH kinase [Woeseiaceae bacterium]|nr:NAD(+)/NADH kinase [Woeseiaceae bacterium]